MLKHLQSPVEDLPSPRPLLVLLEVGAVTLLLPALGLWQHPHDPFFLHAGFPWLVLAPLIISLRYGFAHGLGSAVALCLLLYGLARRGHPAVPSFPGGLALGLFLVAMVAGEFCDMWHRRLHRLSELSQYHQVLMQKFSRSYHLLAMSHDRLERRVLANTRSLRETMTYLRERALSVSPASPGSEELSHLMMEVLGSFGLLQVAALYRVDEHGIIIPHVVAKLGNPKVMPLSDPLLEEALRTKQLTCIRPEETASQSEDSERIRTFKTLLLALPLADVHGRVWGVVTVQEMPFRALSPEHLSLLAVLGGHMGDLMALAAGGAIQFHTSLLRSHRDAREHKLPGMLLGFVVNPALAPPTLLGGLLEQHRGLDQQWLTRNRHGHSVLLMVVPLTDSEGVRGLVHRLESFCEERYGKPLTSSGVRIHQVAIDGTGDPNAKLEALKEACEIHAAQHSVA